MLAVIGGRIEVRVDDIGVEPGNSLMVASWLGNALDPPPLGPRPESRSGATTMKP